MILFSRVLKSMMMKSLIIKWHLRQVNRPVEVDTDLEIVMIEEVINSNIELAYPKFNFQSFLYFSLYFSFKFFVLQEIVEKIGKSMSSRECKYSTIQKMIEKHLIICIASILILLIHFFLEFFLIISFFWKIESIKYLYLISEIRNISMSVFIKEIMFKNIK